jgi:hypothetical protein
VGHPSREKHLLAERRAPVVPMLLGPAIPNPSKSPESKEEWARATLILFTSWRRPSDLKAPNESWSTALDRIAIPPHLMEVIHNIQVFEECKDARTQHAANRSRKRFLNDSVPVDDEDSSADLDASFTLDEALDMVSANMSRELHEDGEPMDSSSDLVSQTFGDRLVSVLRNTDDTGISDTLYAFSIEKQGMRQQIKSHTAVLRQLKAQNTLLEC